MSSNCMWLLRLFKSAGFNATDIQSDKTRNDNEFGAKNWIDCSNRDINEFQLWASNLGNLFWKENAIPNGPIADNRHRLMTFIWQVSMKCMCWSDANYRTTWSFSNPTRQLVWKPDIEFWSLSHLICHWLRKLPLNLYTYIVNWLNYDERILIQGKDP